MPSPAEQLPSDAASLQSVQFGSEVSTATLVGVCVAATLAVLVGVGAAVWYYVARWRGRHRYSCAEKAATAASHAESGGYGGGAFSGSSGNLSTSMTSSTISGASLKYHSPQRRPDVGWELRGGGGGGDHELTTPVARSPATSPACEAPDSAADVAGKLHFAVAYSEGKQCLSVSILKVSHLRAAKAETAAGGGGGSGWGGGGGVDPYVKLHLLPAKKLKVKTRVVKRTLNPVFDETFTFYGIAPAQVHAMTLHFSLCSFDSYSRDDVLGDVAYSLAEMDLRIDHEIVVQRYIISRETQIRKQGQGELLLSLCYQPAVHRLSVVVLKARDLPRLDFMCPPDSYVDLYLLYNGQRIAKRKTKTKKQCANPVYNEIFLFDLPPMESLNKMTVALNVYRWEATAKCELMGRVEVGKCGPPAEQYHWAEMLANPRKHIAQWHKLNKPPPA